MSLTSFCCPNYYLQKDFISSSSIFNVCIVNFEQVKSSVGSMSHRSKKLCCSSFVVRKNVVRGELKTCDTSKINLFEKIIYCLKSLTIFFSLFIVKVIKCSFMAYLCRTTSRRYIYGSFCKTLVCNCSND